MPLTWLLDEVGLGSTVEELVFEIEVGITPGEVVVGLDSSAVAVDVLKLDSTTVRREAKSVNELGLLEIIAEDTSVVRSALSAEGEFEILELGAICPSLVECDDFKLLASELRDKSLEESARTCDRLVGTPVVYDPIVIVVGLEILALITADSINEDALAIMLAIDVVTTLDGEESSVELDRATLMMPVERGLYDGVAT